MSGIESTASWVVRHYVSGIEYGKLGGKALREWNRKHGKLGGKALREWTGMARW